MHMNVDGRESLGKKKDLVLRGFLGGPKIEKYGCISITLQIVIPKWMTMDKKEYIAASNVQTITQHWVLWES